MTDASAPNADRGWMVLGFKLALSLALLAVVFVANRESFAETLSYRPSGHRFLAAFGWYIAGVMLAFVRWWLLVRAVDLPLALRHAFRLGWIGMFFNLVIPGAVGGDVVKAAYLVRDQDRKARAVASIVIDRLIGLLGLFLLAAIAGGVAWERLARPVRPIVVASWVACGVTALLLGLSFAIRPQGPLLRRLGRRERLRRLIEDLHATGVAYRQRLAWVALALLMAMFTHLANVLAFAEVSRALFPARSVPDLMGHLLVVPLVLFSTAIPLPFSGLGAAENVSSLLFRTIQYQGGAVAMLGFRLLQLVAALLGAWLYLTYRKRASRASSQAEPAGGFDADAVQAVTMNP